MGSGTKKRPSYETPATIAVAAPPEEGTAPSEQAPEASLLPGPEGGQAPTEEIVAPTGAHEEPPEPAAGEPRGKEPPAGSPGPTDPVTPLGEGFAWQVVSAGAPGKPLLVGGQDLEDMTAVVVAYRTGDDHRFVLHAKVRSEAEAKLLEAVSSTEAKTALVEREVEVEGRLPLDTEAGLYEQLAKVAKSVNHHVGKGDPVPHHTTEALGKLEGQLAELGAKPGLSPAEHEMLSAYSGAVQQLRTACETKQKSPWISPFQATFTKTVTEEVVLPPDPGAPGLPAKLREATKIAAVEEQGTSRWDGASRKPGKGKEYLIDLGGGYQAIYRPYAKACGLPFSRQGTLEVVAPEGAGPEGLLARLPALNLQAELATREEAELMYLERNAWAQHLTKDPAYLEVQRRAKEVVERETEAIAHEVPPEELAGKGEAELAELARRLALRAERRAIPEKVRLLRRYFEERMGLPEGGLVKLPTYRPLPEVEQGYLVWGRFDQPQEKLRKAMAGKRIVHELTSGNKAATLCRLIESGGFLAATDVRSRMGIHVHSMSPEADQATGGASYVFTRVRGAGARCDLEWDPERVLWRSDWFAYPSDHYGAINPADHHYAGGSLTTDPATLATFNGSSNEVMFKNGLPVLGPHGVRRIWVGSETERQQVLAALAKVGAREIAGRPVEEVVRIR